MAKITPEIKSYLSLLNAEGVSTRDMAAEVKKKYKVAVCQTAIVKHIRSAREERKEIAKGVVEKYVAESIPSDLEIMGEAIQRLNNIAKDKSVKVQHQINANVALLKAVESRLKISGVGVSDKDFVIKIDMSAADDEDEIQQIEEFVHELEVIPNGDSSDDE